MQYELLILGCGYSGHVLARRAKAAGWRVAATSRQAHVREALQADGVDGIAWTAGESVPVTAERVVVLFPPRGTDPEAVAEAIGRHERLVYCSSTSVYGPRSGAWVDESTPVAPSSPWGHARVAAEEAFRRRGACIVRAAGIYGPGRSILDRARAGRLRVTGDTSRPVNMIHVDDLATVLLAACERGVPGRNYTAATGAPTPWIELATRACELTGAVLPAPVPLPDDPNLRMFYEETKRCRSGRLQELGVTLEWPDTLAALDTLARLGGFQEGV